MAAVSAGAGPGTSSPGAQGLSAEVVNLGAGAYLVRPGGRSEPIKSRNFKGAPPTTQWFSSLLFRGKGAENEFPHPLGVRPTAQGLRIHYPGSSISVPANQSAIMGSIPDSTDLLLRVSDQNEFENVQLDDASDWFIRVAFSTGGRGMRLCYGHGSPFIYAEFDGGGASLACAHEPKVWAGSEQDAVLGITLGKNHYGLFGPAGSKWTIQGDRLVNHPGAKRYFSLATDYTQRAGAAIMAARNAQDNLNAGWGDLILINYPIGELVPLPGCASLRSCHSTKAEQHDHRYTEIDTFPLIV